MSEQINLIQELLDYVALYENEVGNLDLKEFSIFLKDKLVVEDNFQKTTDFDKNKYNEYKKYAEVEFSTLLTNLYRFAKNYIKKAFEGKAIKTIDEFGFLATLLLEKSLMKYELINKHMLETSSGSEILKRLVRNGLVYEFPDENDGRAKRVALTEEGKKVIIDVFEDMHIVSEIVVGNLTDKELKEALGVLNKLNYFHQHIYEENKSSGIDEIYQKHIASLN